MTHHIAEIRRAQPALEPTPAPTIAEVAPAIAVAVLAATDIAA